MFTGGEENREERTGSWCLLACLQSHHRKLFLQTCKSWGDQEIDQTIRWPVCHTSKEDETFIETRTFKTPPRTKGQNFSLKQRNKVVLPSTIGLDFKPYFFKSPATEPIYHPYKQSTKFSIFLFVFEFANCQVLTRKAGIIWGLGSKEGEM